MIKEYDGTEDRKMAHQIKNYKNMEISDLFSFECKPKDKVKEKEIMRQLRKGFYSELRELRKIENPTMLERNRLLDLEEKFRDAKKPQMNEAIFYGFEDIQDEYNYGRDIFKEDIYEYHPNFECPYKKRDLYYIPNNPFEEKFETLDGYFKLGKISTNLIKFNVQVKFTEDKDENDTSTGLITQQNKNFSPEDELEYYVNKEIASYDIFNDTFQNKLRYLYLNKEEQKLDKANDLKLPLTSLKVRVYIYRCLNLTAQDNFVGIIDYMAGYNSYSRANAYLQIQIGENTSSREKGTKFVETKDSFVANTLSPDFYQLFELEADLPKEWKLTINVLSHTQGAGSDTVIGSTEIDLEDRFLGEYRNRELIKMKSYETDLLTKLQNLENSEGERDENLITLLNNKLSIVNRKIEDLKESKIPVEYRPLKKPGIKTAQGIIEMFVEVLPANRAKLCPPAKIERPPPEEYELRLVIWETRGLPYEDGRKTIDAMITVTYDPEGYLGKTIQKQTDCHLGCDDGKAIFNWRMKFNL